MSVHYTKMTISIAMKGRLEKGHHCCTASSGSDVTHQELHIVRVDSALTTTH